MVYHVYPLAPDILHQQSIFAIGQIQTLPVTAEQIATTTWQDAVLS